MSSSEIDRFFSRPILNSPYEVPKRHWELDSTGQPTQRIIEARRKADFISPIPKPKKVAKQQQAFDLEANTSATAAEQEYAKDRINEIRGHIEVWRSQTNPNLWQVTPATAQLLKHWRHHKFSSLRPFFCQIEAVETAIWLTEVAPKVRQSKALLDHLNRVNKEAHPELFRLALKLATGTGKTTVMAMLIAWQTVNATRYPNPKLFSRAFLICTPGLTIKDRLRVLLPNDPDNYYEYRELIPPDMLDDVKRAKIVITNFHAFMLRERVEISNGGRGLVEGRTGEPMKTQENAGQMIQRVMGELASMKNIVVLNDEAHHCYREKPKASDPWLAIEREG